MGKKKKGAVASRGGKEPTATKKKRREKKLEKIRRKVARAAEARHVQTTLSSSSSSGTAKGNYTVQDYMEKVEDYLDSFQVDMAVRFCERALQLEPTNLYVLDTLAPLLLEAGDSDRAFQLFEEALRLSPEEGHTKYLYLGQMTQGQDAIRYLTKGIEVMTSASGAGQVGGACAEGGGPGGGGGCDAEELSSAYCALAEVYLTDECFESDAGQHCYECCCKAVELLPGNPEGHHLMASCLLSQQLPERAREALMQGLRLWLPSCRGANEEGEEEEKAGGSKEEGDTEEESDVVYPSYSSRVGVAKLLLELESYELGFEVLECLLKEDDEVVGVWYLMGWLHYLTKDADSAIFYLEQMKTLYTKVGCDEEEILSHATEILAELTSSSTTGATATAEELEIDEEESDKEAEEDTEDKMDVN